MVTDVRQAETIKGGGQKCACPKVNQTFASSPSLLVIKTCRAASDVFGLPAHEVLFHCHSFSFFLLSHVSLNFRFLSHNGAKY